MTVRVRFAPSPTGMLHTGGVRTAVYNWLFARHHGGRFLVRIEDTDRERSRREWADAILDDLRWLGLGWDEEPVYQSARFDRYAAAARRLRAEGKAYPCFCPKETLDAKREAAQKAGVAFRYDRTCRGLSAEAAAEREAAGEPFVIRFALPEEPVTFTDVVHGPKTFAPESLDDFVLVRSSGAPIYNFVVVLDDGDMGITHVIRGDGHLPNTPKQVALSRALGVPTPVFAHLPLIVGPNKKPLSKREGSVSVAGYRETGVLPEALVNYMALLGWSPGDDREILPVEELVAAFTLERVNKSPAVFDREKLTWMNAQYLSRLPAEALADRVRPILEAAGLWDPAFDEGRRAEYRAALDLLKERARTLDDFAAAGRPYFAEVGEYDQKGLAKRVKSRAVPDHLAAWVARLGTVSNFTPAGLETALRALAEERGIKPGDLIHPTRLALTGMPVGPGLFEVMEFFGRERCMERLQAFLRFLETSDWDWLTP